MDFSDKAKRKAYLSERGIFPIRIPAPLIIDHTNVYYIDGKVGVLIDAGFHGEGSLDALTSGLRAAGRDIGDIGLVLLTHGHRDHSGLARKIKEISGARVLLSPRDGYILRPDSFSRYLERVFLYYRDMGVGRETIQEMRSLSEHDRARNNGYPKTETPPIDVRLSPGDRFESGAGTLTAIGMPGHTMGSVSFWLRDERMLFSGDLLSVTYDPLPLVLVEKDGDGWLNTYDEHLSSLSRLVDLDPALLLPGHGAPIARVSRLAERALNAQERIAAKVEDILDSGRDYTIAELSGRIYPGAHGPALTNALNGVRGVATRLAREGIVRINGGGATVRIGR